MDSIMRRERRFRAIHWSVAAIIMAVAWYSLIAAWRNGDTYAVSQAALGFVMLFLPGIIAKCFRFPIPYDCRLLYILFVFCTVIIGSSLYGYARIPYWDKVFHFLSGLLLSAGGLIVCQLCFRGLHGPRIRLQILYVLFPFLFNLAVAALWEVYEYGLYFFLGIDAVNNASTGVHDTLQDMIVCLIGGILFAFLMLWYYRTGHRAFLLRVCEQFFGVRGQTLDVPGPVQA